jgi:hypothetical protein
MKKTQSTFFKFGLIVLFLMAICQLYAKGANAGLTFVKGQIITYKSDNRSKIETE